jgi:hypothetical protein
MSKTEHAWQGLGDAMHALLSNLAAELNAYINRAI